ncbi:uncharacterized protein LOC125047926 [Penaeus chinensis]|uniref:uncharacterized protein LOC125047926 n=1 Tax=Penaeus chinensis TaxID=139456 RepID=UPI001FB7EDE7|nr:uncharacterized protein LOC125047926 [Penaeus chinensis]
MQLTVACQLSRVEDEERVKTLLTQMNVTVLSNMQDLNSPLVFLNGDIFGGLTGDVLDFCSALRRYRRENSLHIGCSIKQGNVFVCTEASRPLIPVFVVEKQKLKVKERDLDPSIPLETLQRKDKLDFLDCEEKHQSQIAVTKDKITEAHQYCITN